MDTSNWEEILQRFYRAQRADSRWDIDRIMAMAKGRARISDDLDAGVREMVDMIAEWENYEWPQSQGATNPLDVLVCRLRETVEVVLSSLVWQPAAALGVRSAFGEAVPCVRTKTSDGVEMEMNRQGDATRLALSFASAARPLPRRVELKRDGQLSDSVPLVEEKVEFSLPVPGVYEVTMCYPDDRRRQLLALALEPAPAPEDDN